MTNGKSVKLMLVAAAAVLLSRPSMGKGKIQPKIPSPPTVADIQETTRTENNKGSIELDAVGDRFRKGELTEQLLWIETGKIAAQMASFSTPDKVRVLQTQSQLLLKDNYQILAAIYAAQAIKISGQAFDPMLETSWNTLKMTSESQPIQNLLENLAEDLKLNDKTAPGFESNWFYYVGNYLTRLKKYPEAIEAYSKVKLTDKYYFPAKFHEAITLVLQEKSEDAVMALQKILFSTSQDFSYLSDNKREEMSNMTRLALGRIFFEMGNFEKSFRSYRAVTKNSPQFYDAIFEQSWAFFMGGYPNHALGALHAAESPFYADRDNPEIAVLKSMIYFWMCHYDESRDSLAIFNEKYQKSISGLGYFLNRNNLTDDSAYELFENYITGVSSESLGIPRELLATAATQDSMMQVRDQYASVLTEKRRLAVSGVFLTRQSTPEPMAYLEKWEGNLRLDLGHRFLKEVMALRDTYDRLHEQSQFLELELLMSEKDHILGKELHAKNKMNKVSAKRNVSGWGKRNSMSWAAEDKEEFWWDEVGYYIYQVEPTCNKTSAVAETNVTEEKVTETK